ncbi:MAG TPA: hypothetical protein VFO52_12495 [Longimicrobiales bacterium]|nr:hypothetical protein [Longimicrobiales bacterium]
MVTEDQARELWRRAAEQQAAAERHREQLAPVEISAEGLTLEQIAQAAEGAGIDPDYVRVSFAEQQLADGDRIDRNLWSARWLRAVMRQPDVIDAARIINAPPAAVLAALRTVTTRPSFEMIPETTVGEDPLRDGVLVYRLISKTDGFHQTMNFSDARVFLFTIRAEGDGTRLRARVPLFRRGVNLSITGGLSGLMGWGGASLGAAATGLLPAAVGGAALVAAAPIVIGGLAGITAGMKLYGKLYRSFYNSGSAGVTHLLHAIAVEAENLKIGT